MSTNKNNQNKKDNPMNGSNQNDLDFKQPQQVENPAQFPGPIYYQDPWATSMAFQTGVAAVQEAERGRAIAEIRNARLQDQLARKQIAENAYREISGSSGRTCTVDRYGRLTELLNGEIVQAYHILPEPPFHAGAYYLVTICPPNRTLILEQTQFSNDSALIQAFRELPGVEVKQCRTTKQTAELLRQAISAQIKTVHPPYWGGWRQEDNEKFSFRTFYGEFTHVTEHHGNIEIRPLLLDAPMSAATMVTATQRFCGKNGFVLSNPELWLLDLTFHTAILTSLLDLMGHPFPLALGILTEDSAAIEGVRSLFEWHGDKAFSLHLPPSIFANALLRRKDEPMIVLDERGGDFAPKNSELLERVISSRMVPWKGGRDERYFPLQSLPVIISNSASPLTLHPSTMVLELSAEVGQSIEAADKEIIQDYLKAFIQYTTAEVEQLDSLLDEGRQDALTLGGDRLTENCLTALGILFGVDTFVRNFHRYCGINVPILDESCPDGETWLLELLEQTSDKLLDYGDLTAQFIAISKSMFSDGALCVSKTKFDRFPSGNIVYYNEDSLFFTSAAMIAVCKRLNQSRPVILAALAEEGLLRGKPINSCTSMTRITVHDVYGQPYKQKVFRLPRAAFEQLGEPLCFDGEDEP